MANRRDPTGGEMDDYMEGPESIRSSLAPKAGLATPERLLRPSFGVSVRRKVCDACCGGRARSRLARTKTGRSIGLLLGES